MSTLTSTPTPSSNWVFYKATVQGSFTLNMYVKFDSSYTPILWIIYDDWGWYSLSKESIINHLFSPNVILTKQDPHPSILKQAGIE